MPNVFADTAGWAHLFHPKEPHHSSATTIYHRTWQQGYKFITTNYVVAELASLLISPLRVSKPRIIEYIEGLRTSPYVEIIHIDPTLDQQAWKLFSAREDKNWSLVDCVSFVVMQQRGITEALTTDHHFEQAGFIRLLKS
jgi:predicted nucleic acid-binding protein